MVKYLLIVLKVNPWYITLYYDQKCFDLLHRNTKLYFTYSEFYTLLMKTINCNTSNLHFSSFTLMLF